MDKKLEELEQKLNDGIGFMTIREGQNYLFEYIHEALRLMREETKKLQH